MDDLQTGDPLLPPDTDTAGALEVVPVHDDVDEQVDGDHHPLHRGQANELGVTQQGRRAVVIGMEEGQRLLLQKQENRVQKLEVLGEIVELWRKVSGGPRIATIGAAGVQLT